jgi:hypothetical protein
MAFKCRCGNVLSADLPPCDPEVFSGKEVCFITGMEAEQVEATIELARTLCGERLGGKLDWSMYAGRALVMTTGDVDVAWDAVNTVMPKCHRQG